MGESALSQSLRYSLDYFTRFSVKSGNDTWFCTICQQHVHQDGAGGHVKGIVHQHRTQRIKVERNEPAVLEPAVQHLNGGASYVIRTCVSRLKALTVPRVDTKPTDDESDALGDHWRGYVHLVFTSQKT